MTDVVNPGKRSQADERIGNLFTGKISRPLPIFLVSVLTLFLMPAFLSAQTAPQLQLQVSRQRVNTDEPVTFTAVITPSPTVPVQFKFSFDDGTEPLLTSENRIVHAFNTPGRHTVEVQASVRARTDARTLSRAATGRILSGQADVQVIRPEQPLPDVQVQLTADRLQVNAGEAVTFEALLTPSSDADQYLFNFGDRSDSGWTSQSRIQRVYTEPGNYPVVVQARSRAGAAVSNRVVVRVAGPEPTQPNLQAHLTADRRQVAAGDPVTFRSTVIPPSVPVQYQFNFGDGVLSEWTEEGSMTHVYRKPGDYSAEVRVRSEAGVVISNSFPVQVLADGPNIPWGPILGISAGIILFIGTYKLRGGRKSPDRLKPPVQPPEVHYIAHVDPGRQTMEFHPARPLVRHVELRPTPDQGRQELDIEGSLVLAERGEP